ncbi:MAG: hypothetical protein ACPG4T_03255, partial [Nannocystaceae bacterium]
MTSTPKDAPPRPPGGRGISRFGETLAFLRSPAAFYEQRRKQHGDVFVSNVLGMRLVSMIGPAANRWIFAGEDRYLQNQWPAAIRRLLGAQSLSLIAGEDHRTRRRLLGPHFSRSGLLSQIGAIADVTTRHLDAWNAIPGESR